MVEHSGPGCNEVWGGSGAVDTAVDLPGLRGWISNQPYRGAEAGGDVHYISACGTGRIIRIMLADVMGHGDAAAGMAGYLRTLMRRFLNHVEPHSLAARVNDLFHHQPEADHRFATAVIMTYFAPTGEVSLCNAGHPPPLIYAQRERRWVPLDRLADEPSPSNLPLGVERSGDYTERRMVLDPGDLILAYTDGLIEATDAAGSQLTTAGLIDAVEAMGDPSRFASPSDFIGALNAGIAARGYRLDADDVSTLLLQCSGRSNGAGWRDRFAGLGPIWRYLREGRAVPWPELNRRTVGGAFIPALNRWGRRET